MAVIGDVLVKFVGDFAEFSKGMEESQKQLAKFGQQAAATGSKIEQFIGQVKAVFKLAVVNEAIGQLKSYTEEVIKHALEVEKLAAKYKLTTDQVQAMQAASKLTGETVEAQNEFYKTHAAALDRLTDAAKLTGQVMSGELVKAIQSVADETDDLAIKTKWLFQSGGGDNVVANAINLVATAIRNVGNSLAWIDGHQAAMAFVIAAATGNWAAIGMAIGGAAAGPPGAQALDQAQATLKKARDILEQEQGRPGTAMMPNQTAAAQRAVDAAEAQLASVQERIRLQEQQNQALATAHTTLNAPVTTVTAARTGGGGGGRTDDDLLQAQINRYTALGNAAEKAFNTIGAGNDKTIEDLKRQVTVQQQVDDIAAKLGAKYSQASQAQKDALYAAVNRYETERAAAQKLLDVNVDAAETQKKYGDGTVALTKLHKDLNDQLKTGRINQDDYNRATKDGTEAIQQAALAARRYDDNLGSLAAGFEHAANAYARQNDQFSVGERAFTGLTDAMGESIDVLVGRSSKGFDQIAGDFALMLSKMALQAALSPVFKYLGSAVGSLFTPGLSAADVAAVQFAFAPGRQGGGPVDYGKPYVVGEAGPELFVPKAAGNIVPLAQSGATGGGITINVEMGQTQGTTNPTQALAFGRKVKAAVADVIRNERRPGGMLYARVTA
jgi:phage-related minor tail protein